MTMEKILLLVTVICWLLAFFIGRSANRMGDGGLGLGMLAMLLGAVPFAAWLIYALIFLIKHVRFS